MDSDLNNKIKDIEIIKQDLIDVENRLSKQLIENINTYTESELSQLSFQIKFCHEQLEKIDEIVENIKKEIN